MKTKKSIAEQVAELTPEQQDTLIKVGKRALIIELIIGIPWIIISLLGFCIMVSPPVGFDYANYDKLFMGFELILVIGAVCMLGIVIFVKVKYPYYTDARWKYIHKMRKLNKVKK